MDFKKRFRTEHYELVLDHNDETNKTVLLFMDQGDTYSGDYAATLTIENQLMLTASLLQILNGTEFSKDSRRLLTSKQCQQMIKGVLEAKEACQVSEDSSD